jgi:hypothetical protein
MTWDIEEIPDVDKLFYRVHQQNYRDGKVVTSTFKEFGTSDDNKGMSTDWMKYSTPSESKARAKKPEVNGIISFIAGELRTILLKVIHYPIDSNRAHTNVKGIDQEKQLKLRSMYTIEIHIP